MTLHPHFCSYGEYSTSVLYARIQNIFSYQSIALGVSVRLLPKPPPSTTQRGKDSQLPLYVITAYELGHGEVYDVVMVEVPLIARQPRCGNTRKLPSCVPPTLALGNEDVTRHGLAKAPRATHAHRALTRTHDVVKEADYAALVNVDARIEAPLEHLPAC